MKIYFNLLEQKIKLKALLFLTLLTAIIVPIGGFEQASAKSLIYCSEASPDGFDAARNFSGPTYDASAWNIFDKLVNVDIGTVNIKPGLATSWEVSNDGLEYIFHLRQGVKFHTTRYFKPSRDFNADDVIFTFKRQSDKNNPLYGDGIWPQYTAYGFDKLIKNIEKIDDHTVKFILNEPSAIFIPSLSLTFTAIQSQEYADQLVREGKLDGIIQQPIGTGAFQFVAYQRDSVIRYKANPDYWGNKQKIDNLIFAITPDASVRYQKLMAGDCHVIAYPNPTDIEKIRNNKNMVVLKRDGLNIAYGAFNTLQPPFNDKRVRRAINMAIDKKAIINAVFLGSAIAAENAMPPSIPSYSKLSQLDYNPQKAKALLDEAGVKNLHMKIWAMPVSRPYMPNARRTAELMQADLAKVGISAEIVSYEWAEYLKQSLEKDRDGMVIIGWTPSIADPDSFLGTLLSCDAIGSSNYANWCNKDFDTLIKQARLTSDQAKRDELYGKAQLIFMQENPWVPIAHQVIEQPISSKVKNYKIDPFGSHSFLDVDIDE